MKKASNIIFLGCTQGYGYSFSACNTKVEFMAKGLTEQGDICYIHNGLSGRPGLKQITYKNIHGIGTIIDYTCKGSRYISSIRNYRNLLKDLKTYYQPNIKNYVIIEAPYLPIYYLEVIAAKKSGYKVIVISHEWLGTFKDDNNRIRTWLNHSYAILFGYKIDAILPISEYIIQKIKKFKKPYFKVPIEADFAKTPTIIKKEKFFLYCVSAEYFRVISMVLKGFKEFNNFHTDYKIVLVLGGSASAINSVYQLVKDENISRNVEIKHKLPYAELFNLYETASGLIVPLDPNFEQDKARFSQKIAEYLSSGTVVISNNVGEIKYYFTNKQDIILNDYTSSGFCDSFKWIVNNPDEAIKIGHRGYKLGKNNFDYRICGKGLHNFLLNL